MEVAPLYMCACVFIDMFAAFYYEGSISLFMEYMDQTSFENIVKKLGPLPELVVGRVCESVRGALSTFA